MKKMFGKPMDRDGGSVAKKPSKTVGAEDSKCSDSGFMPGRCEKMKKKLFRG